MIDAVVSYHMNPQTCGVSKFNHQLAKRLGVPCVPLREGNKYENPLISVKSSEIGADWIAKLPKSGDLFLHDRPKFLPVGRRIWYADEIGCPSTLEGNPTRGAYRVLVFGMAGKLQFKHYELLKRNLDAEHGDHYTVELSTAVHEGSPWDAGLTNAIEGMRAIFGDKLRVLGFLADDALARVIDEVNAIAAYFDPAMRKNNTSIWAGVKAGKKIYTNLDEFSPTEMPTWDGLLQQLSQPEAVVSMTP